MLFQQKSSRYSEIKSNTLHKETKHSFIRTTFNKKMSLKNHPQKILDPNLDFQNRTAKVGQGEKYDIKINQI